MLARHWLAALVLSALAGGSAGQATPLPTPLPEELAGPVAFGSSWAASLFPGEAIEQRQLHHARVSFDPAEKHVELDWSFKAPGAGPGSRVDTVEVPFRPTFVCEAAAHSPVLWVGGYHEPTASVVVERWVVQISRLDAEASPFEGVVESVFDYTLDKQRVLDEESLGPVKTAAYLPTADSLLLFEELAPHTAWLLDVADGQLAPLTDSTQQPLLSTHHAARQFRLEPTAPVGPGGYVIVLYPWRAWSPMFSGMRDGDEVLVFRDLDLDGSLDSDRGLAMRYADYRVEVSQHIDAYDAGP